MIVNYFEPATSFELPPVEALEYWIDKGINPTYNWYEMLNEQHDIAFTVAKMMDADLLYTVQKTLEEMLAEGKTLDDFRQELIPSLQKKGWWGKKDVINPHTGLVETAQLGSASRLENIFRTNLQSSYAAGHWQTIQENKGDAPYLMYDAVDDSRTREEHAQFDNKVVPIDSPFWDTHYPPNGWQCRCGTIQLDADEVEAYGLKISDNVKLDIKKITIRGQTVKVPFGTDPGFAHNSGVSYFSKLQVAQEAKLNKMPPETALAAKKGIDETMVRADAVKKAQKPL